MFFQLEISERFRLSSSAQDLWDLQIHEESPVIGTINLLSAEMQVHDQIYKWTKLYKDIWGPNLKETYMLFFK